MITHQRGISSTIFTMVAIATIAVAAIGVLVATDLSSNSTTGTNHCCTDANLNLSTPCSAISSDSPSVQRLRQQVEVDPSFVAAEEGHNYTSNGDFGCGFVGSPNDKTVGFGFTYTSDKPYTDNCGYTWNLRYYLRVSVPLTESGYDLSAIQVVHSNDAEITVTCTTTMAP